MSDLATIAALVSDETPDWRAALTDPEAHPDGLVIATVNPYAVYMAARRPAYLEHLAEVDFVYADGILMSKLASHIHGRVISRLTFDGGSLAPEVFGIAAQESAPVYLVGSEPGVADLAAEKFKNDYGIIVAGTRHGFFDSSDEVEEFYDELLEVDPALVVCGMGVTHQERFLVGLRRAGWRGVSFTCGAYLHQTVDGGTQYYPEWINESDLRSLYRVFREPRRMSRRYLVEYGPFFRQAAALLRAERTCPAARAVS